jgi:uncharacterized protein (DUF427 family)
MQLTAQTDEDVENTTVRLYVNGVQIAMAESNQVLFENFNTESYFGSTYGALDFLNA